MTGIDDIRLEQFRQLKKEIRGSEEYLIIGVDVAKEQHRAFFGTARELPPFVVPLAIRGFDRSLTILAA
jgi:hypothetical protein